MNFSYPKYLILIWLEAAGGTAKSEGKKQNKMKLLKERNSQVWKKKIKKNLTSGSISANIKSEFHFVFICPLHNKWGWLQGIRWIFTS